MKGRPLILISGEGYVSATIETATHLGLNFPGPVGELVLPVITHGPRRETPNWTWNGSVDSPTLRPSVKTNGSFDGKDYICHSWVTDGRVQFLSDTTHELSGQTVDLLDI